MATEEDDLKSHGGSMFYEVLRRQNWFVFYRSDRMSPHKYLPVGQTGTYKQDS